MSMAAALPGGNSSEHVVTFSQNRLNEIEFLKQVVGPRAVKRLQERDRGTTSVCSKRRTRSYLSYKIPRRIRVKQLAEKENKKTSVVSVMTRTERVTRRTRRKPSNLRLLRLRHRGEAVQLSQQPLNSDTASELKVSKARWLHTHNWQVKRMHMKEVWGIKLGQRSMARGCRSVGRTIKKGAVIQDTSFLSAYCLRGLSLDQMKEVIGQFMDPSDAKCFSDAEILSGVKEQEVWLWFHPATVNTITGEMLNSISELTKSDVSHVAENYFFAIPNISRFSLRGVASQAILSQVFWPQCSSRLTDTDKDSHSFNKVHDFFNRVLKSEGLCAIWKDGYVLSIEAIDVRMLSIYGSGKKSILKPDPARPWEQINREQWESKVCIGDKICDKMISRLEFPRSVGSPCVSSMTDSSRTPRTSDAELNKRRAHSRTFRAASSTEYSAVVKPLKNFKSSIEVAKCNNFDSIPVTFFRRGSASRRDIPGHDKLFNSLEAGKKPSVHLPTAGWDIVIPSEWASTVWRALQFAGAHCIGLEEAEYLVLESGGASFPRDYVDTPASIAYWQEKRTSISEKMSRFPKQDTQHCKNLLGSVSIFDKLPALNGEENLDMVVVRSSVFLKPFIPTSQNEDLKPKVPLWRSIVNFTEDCKVDSSVKTDLCMGSPVSFPFRTMPFLTLVSVLLSTTGRGVLRPGAAIFSLSETDIKQWLQCRHIRRKSTVGGGKRFGEWKGVQSYYTNNEGSSGRRRIGYITSGSCSYAYGGSVGIGCCGAVQLYECLGSTAKAAGVHNLATRIVLFKNVGSNWLRPAELKVLASS